MNSITTFDKCKRGINQTFFHGLYDLMTTLSLLKIWLNVKIAYVKQLIFI